MGGLAKRQRRGLCHLHDCLGAERSRPTRDEIRDRSACRSPNSVAVHLRALERKGYTSRAANRARAVRLALGRGGTTPTAERGFVSILEQIALGRGESGGQPICAARAPKGGTRFPIGVPGDSIRDAGIEDGAVLKRVLPSDAQLVLRSENTACSDLAFRLEEGNGIRIVGRWGGLLKWFR